MAVSEERFGNLQADVRRLGERIATIEGRLHPVFMGIVAAIVVTYGGWLGVRVISQGNQISQILVLLSPNIIQNAATHPGDPQSAKAVDKAVNAAVRHNEQIDPTIVAQAGTKFIEAAEKTPTAWEAALKLVSYRSSLNVSSRIVQAVPVPPGSVTEYSLGPPVAGKPMPALSQVSFTVSGSDAARFETIGKNLNTGRNFGPVELILTGGAVSLDDKVVRHVVFDRVEIHYTGKSLTLQDAIFVNCTFVMDNNQPGRALGQQLLTSSNIDFMNGETG